MGFLESDNNENDKTLMNWFNVLYYSIINCRITEYEQDIEMDV